MPFNGAGTFTRLYSWVADAIAGRRITAARTDAEMDGFAAGLSNTITRDGQSTVVAPIPMSGQRLTDLGNAEAAGDAVSRRFGDGRYAQLGAAGTFSASMTFAASATFNAAPTFANGAQSNGSFTIASGNAPFLDLVYGGVMRARWIIDGNGTTILRNGDNADNFFYVTTGGAIWTKQFGDLNARIEARAEAYAAVYAGGRVAKTGDTMTGDLTISKAYPTVTLLWGGVYRVGLQLRENARTYLMELDTGTAILSVGPGGDIQTRQLGDLATWVQQRADNAQNEAYSAAVNAAAANTEVRAAAFADDRANARLSDVRWVFVTDRVTATNAGRIIEDYGGSAISGWQDNGSYPVVFRFRQLQLYKPSVGWYASYFA